MAEDARAACGESLSSALNGQAQGHGGTQGLGLLGCSRRAAAPATLILGGVPRRVPNTVPCPYCLCGSCLASANAGSDDPSTLSLFGLCTALHLHPRPCSAQPARGQHRHPSIGASTASRHLPRSQPLSADLFLRAVESLLHVLGEDARLDVGHGCCGPQSWKSRARSGPMPVRRSPGRGGGAGGGSSRSVRSRGGNG